MDGPTDAVRDGFGVVGDGVRLEGGQGTAWRYGELVLKPLDMPREALAWQAEHLPHLPKDDFRVVPPVAARTSELEVDGWTAWKYTEGTHEPGRWQDIIATGNKFHEALEDRPRPSFTQGRDDRWAVADRIAWGEESVGPATRSPLVNRLLAATTPVKVTDQLVHCDLTGNVLFHQQLKPAIIDLSLYWRPRAYATGVVVTDAITFEGAGDDLVEMQAGTTGFGQCLLRAIAFRLITDRLAGIEAAEADAPYLRIARLAQALAQAMN